MSDSERHPAGRALEAAGLVAALTALAVLLLRAYELLPYSDPARWYLFGRNFGDAFGRTELAYGFPLLVSGAISWVGPGPAFLVNLPVLVLFAGLLYAFARLHVDRAEPELGAVAGSTALALLVWLDADLLLRIVNPFRDPLAHLWVLVSCSLAVLYRRSPQRSRWMVAGAGISLALACSTRETSVLVLGPLVLYALLSRRSLPSLPLARPALVFAVSFGIALAPFLVQNALISGNPLLPGQASVTYETQGLVPGVRATRVVAQAPLLIAALAEHYGVLGGALLVLGLVAGAVRRELAVLALSAPAWMILTLFYTGYDRVVPRYLFVLELFALPIAGAGVSWLVELLLRRAPQRRLIAGAVAAGLSATTVGIALQVANQPRDRARLEDVTRFVRHVEAALPAGATIVGTRPVIDIVRVFGDVETRAPRDRWSLRTSLESLFGRPGDRYLLTNDPVAIRIVESAYDLKDPVRFGAAEYALDAELGSAPIRLARVVPWSRRRSALQLPVSKVGDFALVLDVGSLRARSGAPPRVLWDGVEVAGRPNHRVDAFPVAVSSAPRQIEVALDADRPVPSRISASLVPLDAPISFSFEGEDLAPLMDRLSPSFLMRPKLGYPTLTSQGFTSIPTVARKGAAFVVKARVGLLREYGSGKVRLATRAAGRSLSEISMGSPAGGVSGTQWKWKTVFFVLPPDVVRSSNTRVEWRMMVSDRSADAGEQPIVALKGFHVFRVALRENLRIDLSAARAARFLVGGFHPAGEEKGRWTRGEASLRLLVAPSEAPTRLTVRYRTGVPSGSAPQPVFRLDGKPLHGAQTREERGDDVIVTERFEIGPLGRIETRLEIQSDTYKLVGTGRVGVLLESVEVERQAPDPGA